MRLNNFVIYYIVFSLIAVSLPAQGRETVPRFINSGSDSNVVLMNHRHYSSSLGRFISQDGVKQLTSQYNYTNGDVIRSSDPSGLMKLNARGEIIEETIGALGAEGDSRSGLRKLWRPGTETGSGDFHTSVDTLEGDINTEDTQKLLPNKSVRNGSKGKVDRSKGAIPKGNGSVVSPYGTEFQDALELNIYMRTGDEDALSRDRSDRLKTKYNHSDAGLGNQGGDGFHRSTLSMREELDAAQIETTQEQRQGSPTEPEPQQGTEPEPRVVLTDFGGSSDPGGIQARYTTRGNYGSVPPGNTVSPMHMEGGLIYNVSRLKKKIAAGVTAAVLAGGAIFGVVELASHVHSSGPPSPAPAPCKRNSRGRCK